MPHDALIADTVTEIPQTTEAIKQGLLDLPESGQQFFATVAASETRRIETKKVAQANFHDAVPFESMLAVILKIGVNPDETIMLQNEAIDLLRTSLIAQTEAQFATIYKLGVEEGAAVAEAEHDIGSET